MSGVAKAYFDNDWSSADLTALFELAALNGARFMDAIEGSAPFRLFNWLAHRAKANTRRGSRRNIEAHYDLGNEFYRLWLDAKMIYSSAIFGSTSATLEQAQEAKLQRIVDRLQLAGGDSVLEIGCGWGGLATTIAQDSAARVTGVTISPAQLDNARALVQQQALEDRVELRLQDYRDVKGRFDRIVSIEMVEAVGREFMPKYFETIRERLKPGGLCVLQAITIAEDRFADYCRRPDFIQRYIFPGGFLPSKTFLRETIEQAGLKLTAVENFGGSYALTLREWRRRFLNAWPEIEKLGFGPSVQAALGILPVLLRGRVPRGRHRCRHLFAGACQRAKQACALARALVDKGAKRFAPCLRGRRRRGKIEARRAPPAARSRPSGSRPMARHRRLLSPRSSPARRGEISGLARINLRE